MIFSYAVCGMVGLEPGEALHQALHVGRADVGTIGVAEIDDPVLAVEIAPADGLAAAVAAVGRRRGGVGAGARTQAQRRRQPCRRQRQALSGSKLHLLAFLHWKTVVSGL